jgi:dimethylhistidine N-methyltransferase
VLNKLNSPIELTSQALSGIPVNGTSSSAQAEEIAHGLMQREAMLAPKYFYDDLGSQLFHAITLLDEYYPPRVEAKIFADHAAGMAQWLGDFDELVDIGAADGKKAQSLFSVLDVKRYVAVDISADYLTRAVDSLQRTDPQIEMRPLVQDFSERLFVDDQFSKLFFYPGSSLGNFTPEQAKHWLTGLRQHQGCSGLLLGIDLVKPKHLLDAAYDDALGVTASFNLNALRHVNRILDSDFDPKQWQHRGFFNEALSRIEMRLEARQALRVRWPSGERAFSAGESIHTESSYKYTIESLEVLLKSVGFSQVKIYTDSAKWFAVVCAKP